MTKLETCAKAAFLKFNGEFVSEYIWRRQSPAGRERWLAVVDAILAELSNPTPEMLDCAQDDMIAEQVARGHEGHITEPVILKGWQAMLRIIKEGK